MGGGWSLWQLFEEQMSDSDKAALGREERFVQVMTFSVNGVLCEWGWEW